jgi:hypothetical protein
VPGQNNGRNFTFQGVIKVRTRPVVVELPLLPELEAELSCAPAGNLTILVTEYGRPFSENRLGNKMRQWCDEAGLPDCSAQGVRKAGATVMVVVTRGRLPKSDLTRR